MTLHRRVLSVPCLRCRGALLTPKEMEELTECWRPYRTLGKRMSSPQYSFIDGRRLIPL